MLMSSVGAALAWILCAYACFLISVNSEDPIRKEGDRPLPNIIILLADNLGFADVSPERTPHISSIGDQGLTLGNFHSAAHLCSASRAALLTGVYPAKSGVYPGTFSPDAAHGLSPLRFPMVATLLKEQSQQKYATAMIGKWHLGHAHAQFLPTQHGFDEYLGIPYHMSGGSIDDHICAYDAARRTQWLPLYHNTTIVQQPVNIWQLAETYATAATRFIQRQVASNQPFFLYMAFSHVHQLCASFDRPEQSFCQWSGTDGDASSFQDAVQEMDWIVGEILATLKQTASMNDTIVLFTSDNGPWLAEQSCAGLRGPFQGQWLRENVPLNCTACPKDYVPNPTLIRPRRCTLQPLHSTNDGSKSDFSEQDDDPLSVDGVHCGEDSGLGSVWEANLRMPTLIQWPGNIAANTNSMALVSSLDVTPTLLSLAFGNATIQNDQFGFDGLDISSVLLGREDDYNSDERILFFWRDGFLLDSAPLGPPYGRFDVVAVKVGRIKAWFWTKSAHYNADVEVFHDPPLLFDTIEDPAEAYPLVFPYNDTTNEYTKLVARIHRWVDEHKLDVASFHPYPLTLARDSKYIPCVDPSSGCRTTPTRPLLSSNDGYDVSL